MPATRDNPYDFNRDKLVNAADQIITRNNQTFADALKLITTPSVVATDDTAATDEDTAAFISVLSIDRDTQSGTLSVYGVDATSGFGAALTVMPDNTIRYDPSVSSALQALSAGQSLWDTFTYTIQDSHSRSDMATVRVSSGLPSESRC